MRGKVLIILLTGALICFFTLGILADKKEDVDKVRKTIEKTNLIFGEAIRKGDAAALATLYTEDATLLPPNHTVVKGKEGIKEFWNTTMQSGVKDAVLTTVEVAVSGHLTYEIGKFVLKVQPEGQEPIEAKGKYVVVYKHQDDGSWKLHVDIWNSDPPPLPPTP